MPPSLPGGATHDTSYPWREEGQPRGPGRWRWQRRARGLSRRRGLDSANQQVAKRYGVSDVAIAKACVCSRSPSRPAAIGRRRRPDRSCRIGLRYGIAKDDAVLDAGFVRPPAPGEGLDSRNTFHMLAEPQATMRHWHRRFYASCCPQRSARVPAGYPAMRSPDRRWRRVPGPLRTIHGGTRPVSAEGVVRSERPSMADGGTRHA